MTVFFERNYNTVGAPPVLLATVKKGQACLHWQELLVGVAATHGQSPVHPLSW